MAVIMKVIYIKIKCVDKVLHNLKIKEKFYENDKLAYEGEGEIFNFAIIEIL